MIVTRLIGGLGNQLFQYALGRYVAHTLGVELALDRTPFEQYTLHTYSLDSFNVHERFANDEEIAESKRSTIYSEQSEFVFDPTVLEIGGSVYFQGYWQVAAYLEPIKELLYKEMSVTTPQQGVDSDVSNDIQQSESVSLHVRRADYVTNDHTNSVHGECPLTYYSDALQYIVGRVHNPKIYIFSDDAEWAKENIKTDFEQRFVDHNGPDKNYEDLRLMSQCKHNIIANSTFSWWGAWLNNHEEKIVIAPRQWFRDGRATPDLIPESWVTI